MNHNHLYTKDMGTSLPTSRWQSNLLFSIGGFVCGALIFWLGALTAGGHLFGVGQILFYTWLSRIISPVIAIYPAAQALFVLPYLAFTLMIFVAYWLLVQYLRQEFISPWRALIFFFLGFIIPPLILSFALFWALSHAHLVG